MMTGKHQ